MGVELDGANQKIIIDADSDTYLQANTDDTIDMYIAGAKDFTFTANTLTAQSGSTIAAQALTATTIGATGVVSISDGSASAPALTNTGDTNCGLYFSAADTLSFTAAGTAQITMADGVVAPVTDNDVDIGTSSLEFKDGYFDGTLYCDTLNLAGTNHTSISGGIEQFDQWRLTAGLSASADPISANLERVDDTGFEKIGTGMSVSSGVWTFPVTGLWTISFYVQGDFNSAGSFPYIYHTTDNGSNWSETARGHVGPNSGWYDSTVLKTAFNVTDLSNHKVKFRYNESSATATLYGNTGYNATFFEFIRLADSQ